jgi:aspartate beta-hydroxylase
MTMNGGRLLSMALQVRYADNEEEEWPISAEDASRWLQRGDAPYGQASSFVFRGLTAQPVWDIGSSGPALCQLCRALEASFPELRREAVALLYNSLFGDGSDSDGSEGDGIAPPLWRSANGEGLVSRGAWQKVPLWTGGVRHDEACARLPRAAFIVAAFAGAPVMMHPPGRVFYSLMLPGTHIAPHAGPTNHRLRMHLPLVLPPAAATAAGARRAAHGLDTEGEGDEGSQPYMIVGGRRLVWQEGRCLLFDDSFTHEVHYPAAPARPQPVSSPHPPPVSASAPPPVAPFAPSRTASPTIDPSPLVSPPLRGRLSGAREKLNGGSLDQHAGCRSAVKAQPPRHLATSCEHATTGAATFDSAGSEPRHCEQSCRDRTHFARPTPPCDDAWESALRSVRLLLVLDVWHPQATDGPFPICNRKGQKRPSGTPEQFDVQRRQRVAS